LSGNGLLSYDDSAPSGQLWAVRRRVAQSCRAAKRLEQRTQFIADHLRETLSITQVCALYGISRKTSGL
jgi:hypothetical protein